MLAPEQTAFNGCAAPFREFAALYLLAKPRIRALQPTQSPSDVAGAGRVAVTVPVLFVESNRNYLQRATLEGRPAGHISLAAPGSPFHACAPLGAST